MNEIECKRANLYTFIANFVTNLTFLANSFPKKNLHIVNNKEFYDQT